MTPTSPLLTPSIPGSGLSAIAERQLRPGALGSDEDIDLEEEGEGGEMGEAEGESGSDVEDGAGQELQRGMEGERVVRSGYLLKKQERRGVSLKTGTVSCSLIVMTISCLADEDVIGMEEEVVRFENR